jgi:hypothetical protein
MQRARKPSPYITSLTLHSRALCAAFRGEETAKHAKKEPEGFPFRVFRVFRGSFPVGRSEE